jgi:hypothetical protein
MQHRDATRPAPGHDRRLGPPGDHDAHRAHDGRARPQGNGGHAEHHAHMVADFRRRFFVCLGLTLPIVWLSPMLRGLVGLAAEAPVPGRTYVLLGLATVIYGYGGWPFLTGMVRELRGRRPGAGGGRRGAVRGWCGVPLRGAVTVGGGGGGGGPRRRGWQCERGLRRRPEGVG